MPIFIELHNTNGNSVFVNVDKIELFYPANEASVVVINGEENLFTESIAEIISILKKVEEYNV